MTRSTTKLALAAALPLEFVNYFIVGYPAGAHLAVPTQWFQTIAAQWYVLHLPGLFALNQFDFLRNYAALGATVMLLSGYLDTAVLLAAFLWPVQVLLRALKKPSQPSEPGD
jgi:hypothetical protein